MTAVLRELKETEIKDKRADYEARADQGAKCQTPISATMAAAESVLTPGMVVSRAELAQLGVEFSDGGGASINLAEMDPNSRR